MNLRSLPAWLALCAIAAPAVGSAQSTRLYRWVDENGEAHYSDAVPPEHARRAREVLNQQGIAVGFEQGELTPEEIAEAERLAKEAELAKEAAAERARHDRMLLDTYLTVGDIEKLRDRRLELLESQIKVTELYLQNLRKLLVDLQGEASRYKPYTVAPEAPQIPEDLQADISRTAASINRYEETLARTRTDQTALREAFANDITRFKELQGI